MPPDQEPMTVVLATDSFLIGDGLSALLADVPEVEVVGRARNLNELSGVIEELTPNAVIISVRSQVVTTMATVAAARRLRVTYPDMGIVVISDRANGFAVELLRGGSSGIAFLLDERLPGIGAVLGALQELKLGQSVLDPTIVDSLIRRGNSVGINDLTRREAEVLEKMAHGLSNRAIADELHISVKSIEKGVTAIFLKLGPFDQGSSDRRVSAALVFLRAQTDPFGPNIDVEVPSAPIVVLKDPAALTGRGRPEADDSTG
jgi:DNA-binding NarL/FixJ family response regulator